jgi:hypothetical protein
MLVRRLIPACGLVFLIACSTARAFLPQAQATAPTIEKLPMPAGDLDWRRPVT